jgi:hypothetical protein
MFSAEIDDSGEPFLMRAIVKKWGNSAAVRIPRGIMQAAHVGLHEVVRSARIHAD